MSADCWRVTCASDLRALDGLLLMFLRVHTEKVTYSNLGPLFHNAIIRQVLFLSTWLSLPFRSALFAHISSSAGAHAGR